MCSVIILRRRGNDWPVIVAANRDEMLDRPWRGPGAHWRERPGITAGMDTLGGGTWLGMNQEGVICGVLNRINTLGPAPGLKSRGELPLMALEHASAAAAATSFATLDATCYRPFNLFVIDACEGYWLRALPGDASAPAAARIEVSLLPEGLSMLTAYDLNDDRSPRIRRYLPLFRAADAPDPELGDWSDWISLLADRQSEDGAAPGGAMTVITPTGFGTVCSSLIALPAAAAPARAPVWLFAAGQPGQAQFTRAA